MAPKLITCSICDRAFSKRFSLNRHMTTVHQVVPVVGRRSIMCPVPSCGSNFPYLGPLRTHLKDVHEITLEDIEIGFTNMEEFFNWKRREEETYAVKYVKACGTQRLMDGVEVYRFNCFRTGLYNPEGKGLRRLKAQGSCKIGASCPSTITAHRKVDGQVTCSYCMTHVGHEVLPIIGARRPMALDDAKLEGLIEEAAARPLRTVHLDSLIEDAASRPMRTVSLGSLTDGTQKKLRPIFPKEHNPPKEPIDVRPSKVTFAMFRNYQIFADFNVTTEDRFIICNSVAQELSVDDMFDRIRKSVYENTDREFEAMYNNLKMINRYSMLNDMTTDFQLLTEQCNASQETPVVFYEGLVSDSDGETSDTFILVVMNSYQVEILKYFGHQGKICVDPVYSVDDTGFIAVALYVWTTHNDWLLCSLCFCQNFNYTTIKSFFNQVHTRTGSVAVKMLITEDNELIHTAWGNVMGGNAEWVLSPWHIDQKLRTKMKSLAATDQAKMACLYRLVRNIIETTSEEKFNEHLGYLSKQAHTNIQMACFNKFVQDCYIWRKYNWAKYCRSESERKALSLAEATHLLTRRICHGEDLNLGQTLFTIFQYYRVKCQPSLTDSGLNLFSLKDSSTSPVTCPNLNELGDVYVTRMESHKVWSLQIGGAAVDVIPTGKICSQLCSIRCTQCQVCVHKYRCTCVESAIQWKFCKHIHLIGHHLINCGKVEEEMEDEDEVEIVERNEAVMEKVEMEDRKKSNLVHQENVAVVVNDDEKLHSSEMNSLVLDVENISQEINNCAKSLQRVEDLKNLRKAMQAALTVAQSLAAPVVEKPSEYLQVTLEDHNYTM